MKISELLQGSKLINEDSRPVDNFTADDLHHLSQIKDLSKAKQFALELITRPSQKPMKPNKVAWFKTALAQKNSVQAVTKMLWDMLLSGEGHRVIGSIDSTADNKYRQKFGESAEMMHRGYDLDPVSAMLPDKRIIRLVGRHSVTDLPVGSIVLHADLHDDGEVHKASYRLFKKVVATDDLMAEAFEEVGYLDVSSYARSAEVELAFAQEAPKYL